jgi:glucose-1-phosphatase
MLLGVPQERAALVRSLTSKYDLYVLSNTCELHIAIFEKMFRKVAGISVQDQFRRAYYSHEIGFHKPDPEAFKFVLADSGILAKETLFLDDNIHNVKAAQELGFNVLHISEYLPLDEIGFDL